MLRLFCCLLLAGVGWLGCEDRLRHAAGGTIFLEVPVPGRGSPARMERVVTWKEFCIRENLSFFFVGGCFYCVYSMVESNISTMFGCI